MDSHPRRRWAQARRRKRRWRPPDLSRLFTRYLEDRIQYLASVVNSDAGVDYYMRSAGYSPDPSGEWRRA